MMACSHACGHSILRSPQGDSMHRSRRPGRGRRPRKGPADHRHPLHRSRGGLLAEGALLATTSYPDRTSPVLRGKWLLNNIFGLSVPPPPPTVDRNLETKPGAKPTSIRERLAHHRQDPSCNGCHWRISTSSAGGGPSTNRASRWTGAALRRAVQRLTGSRDCGRCSLISLSNFPAPSLKNLWPTLSGAGSNTTIGRQYAKLSATQRPMITVGRRSFSGLWRVPRS